MAKLFYTILLFVIEPVFISEQIPEYRFKAVLEIIDKFKTKLNVFNYLILSCWFNILEI